MTKLMMTNFAFFGTDEFAVTVLEQLKTRGLIPSLIVTTTDKPKGRKLILTPNPVKLWAQANNIKIGEPEAGYDLFVVASYGKIIKQAVLNLPTHGTLNIHPSLLPQYRGPTPIQSAILNGNRETGVSIMLLDEQVDHGPIIKSQTLNIQGQSYPEARDNLAKLGAELLAEVMPKWVAGKIKATEQDHSQATFTKKIEKADGEIKLDGDAKQNFHKFLAYQPWPGIYFFENERRIKITDVVLENNIFIIKKVIPEGKSEMTWEAYQLGH
jgi:methionyl-tRNA formyltransferase